MKQHEQQFRQGGGGGRDNRPGGGYGGSRESIAPLKKEEKFKFMNDEKTMVSTADNWGKQWHECKLTSAQLRKFYHEVVAIFAIAESEMENQKTKFNKENAKKEAWDKVKLPFRLLKAKAAYGLRDKGKKDSMQDLVNFIQWGTEEVNDFDALERFKLYFEAAVGFYYGYGEIKSN